MEKSFCWSLALSLIALWVCAVSASAGEGLWVKGNTHAHSNRSDGNVPPEQVAKWFMDHGYNFVVLTDHNTWMDTAALPASPSFVVIPGEEVSASFGSRPVHVNALGLATKVAPATGATLVETIQNNVDAVLKAGAIPHINHPNWRAAFDHRQLLRVERSALMEIYNASSGCNDQGDNAHLPTEQIWDVLLSSGRDIYGTATDDSHNYTQFAPEQDNPGRAWVMVRVEKLTPTQILKSLRAGDFYASTGIELTKDFFDGRKLQVAIRPKEGLTYFIRFVGKYGRVLKEVDGLEAECALTDTTQGAYLRAKAIASDGTVAWTQAFRRAK